MSWLARSIANSLRIDDDDPSPAPENPPDKLPPENEQGDRRTGMKDDLTEFRETLTRQFQGVATFLAPPPPPVDPRVVPELNRSGSPAPSTSDNGEDENENDSLEIRGLDNQGVLVGINGFRLENMEYDDEDWVNEAAGLTDEVLTFAGNIAHHPETWLDFPIEDDEDVDDFPMSEAQKRHTRAVEHFTPRLAALRIELCPAHMSEGFFWKVYLVLLLSRLNKQDAELLSTPEIVEARAKWMQELQKRAKKELESHHSRHFSRQSGDLDEDFTPTSLQNDHSETFSSWTFASEPATSSTTADADSDTEEMKYTNKSIIHEKPVGDPIEKNAPVSKRVVINFDDDDDDDWPEDDCEGHSVPVFPVGIEDEVSFSDLEDDDCCMPIKPKHNTRV